MAESESAEQQGSPTRSNSSFRPRAMRKHKKQITAGLRRLQKFDFCYVKLFNCNGNVSTCFSNAFCESVRNIEDHDELNSDEDGRTKVAKFNELFDIDLLLRVLDEPVDLDTTQRIAFERFESFMENIENVSRILLENAFEDMSEADLAGLIGIHVLKPLAVEQQMVISDSSFSGRKGYCCCNNRSCKEELNYGDTSLGHPRVWHGSVDILLGSTAVVCVDGRDQECLNTVDDLKTDKFEQRRQQLIAEAIVFGFVQKLELVPLIAISKDYRLQIFLYSSDHDLLYEGMECNLFHDIMGKEFNKTLSHSVVILLWFTLNYEIFLKGVDPSHLENAYTSDFKAMIGKRADVLDIYENQLRFRRCKQAPRSVNHYVFNDY